MIFKCPECKKELTQLEVVVSNVTSYGTVSLFDDGTLECWDLDTEYDGSTDTYNCPHCGYEFPIHDEDALTKYLQEVICGR
jgi:DNA-directed RNA polymerase subunit RPC12/RpoP